MAHKLLVVDDDKDVTITLSHMLARAGYEVVVAFDGEEALRKVAEENPDVILLDLIMPKLNGFEVLKEIRARYKDRWRPVIIISAQAELETMKKCYDMEADHYLSKPCSIENILQGIRTMISLIPCRKDS
ncbi:MAG: response regulator [Candidatus Omnitrophica bacterium]|nr:response regulator [Candidatus Omnitrophota bacterium]